MNKQLENKAIKYLQQKLTPEFFNGLKEAKEKNPQTWWAENGWHFHQGMAIRNLLRNIILDKDLSSGNWDDYYISVLEKAATNE